LPTLSAFTDPTVSVAPGKSGDGVTDASATGASGTAFTLSVVDVVVVVVLFPQDARKQVDAMAMAANVCVLIVWLFVSKILL